MSNLPSSTQEGPSRTTATSTLDLSSLASSLPSLVSNSSPGSDSGLVSSQDGRIPAIPLEILERILRYTFLRRTTISPSSDPYPLRNTTHLLLVSKAFRELCIPFFFQHITIGRHSDYATFFDPENGIFVVGNEGRRRWSFVKVLGFAHGVEPPSRYPTEEDESWIVSLSPPVGGDALRTIAIFNHEACSSAPSNDREVYSQAAEDETRRASVIHEIMAEYRRSPYFANGGREFHEWVQAAFDRDISGEIDHRILENTVDSLREARNGFYRRLLPSRPTLVFRVSEDIRSLLQLASIVTRSPNDLLTTLYVHRPPGPKPSNPVVLSSCFDLVQRELNILFLVLVGYSTENRPCFLHQFHEADTLAQRTWRYVAKGTEEVYLVPDAIFESMVQSENYHAVAETEELAWRGIEPPRDVVDENEDEEVETQSS